MKLKSKLVCPVITLYMLLIIQQVLEAHGLKPIVLKPKEVSQEKLVCFNESLHMSCFHP